MLHKLDGFIRLDTVLVDCYSNALQYNGQGVGLPDTVAHIHSRAQTQGGTTRSQEPGTSRSNEKKSRGTEASLTDTLFPPSTAGKNNSTTPQDHLVHTYRGATHTHTLILYTLRDAQRGPKIPVLIIADGEKGTEAIIIAHTSRLVPPRKGKRLMIFLVQAIKKLFVTCQAAYDVRDLGKRPQSNSVYAGKKQRSHTMPATPWRATLRWQGVGEREKEIKGKKGKNGT